MMFSSSDYEYYDFVENVCSRNILLTQSRGFLAQNKASHIYPCKQYIILYG